jgi:hypothetical protein
VEVPANVARKRRVTASPLAVQRFGIDDRQWNQVTASRISAHWPMS